eukprot:4976703-Lingulodinium_polyedra.AAC.1
MRVYLRGWGVFPGHVRTGRGVWSRSTPRPPRCMVGECSPAAYNQAGRGVWLGCVSRPFAHRKDEAG